ncbi:MAG: M20/M25/M40 family metallo-hydrolase [Reichenbachiella sp.]|uniref:M28 family metallopeptidase n=1 Tax=Reichenbachiella sp. TaxID=2184521 RepID=UPI003265F4F5
MKIRLTLLVLILLSYSSFGQDLSYAKEIVEQLASPDFYGRGYVAKGDKLAAEYISNEFEGFGLQTFGKNYFQKFKTSVNTFPSNMKLVLNDEEKIAGTDYLVHAGSPAIKGKFSTVRLSIDEMLDPNTLSQKLRSAAGQFLVIPAYDPKEFSKEQQDRITEVLNFIQYHPDNPAAGTLLLTKGKLTWSASTTVYSKPTFTVKINDSQQGIQEVSVDVTNKYFDQYQSQNIVGYIDGQNTDSLIVLVAHYDHLGMMGSAALFPGANDNASGVAMLLNLAKYYSTNKPKYNTVFIAFGAEELGLIGAKYFVDHPLIELSKIKFLINFDISGTGDDGIQVVNGKVYKDRFDRLVEINAEQELLKQVKIRGEACNSDHCMFHMKKVPCFFIYTLGGIQAYHDIYDKSETLPLTEFEDYFKLITLFVDEL